jgi:outer membrane biosynthesis protein TonB
LFAQAVQFHEAELVSIPKVQWPEVAEKAKLGGKVVARVKVDKAGKVSSVEEVTGPDWVCPAVTTPAVDALRDVAKQVAMKAKFKPAMRNGEAVQSEMLLNVQFPVLPPEPTATAGAGLIYNRSEMRLDRVNPASQETDDTNAEDISAESEAIVKGKAIKLAKPNYPAAARAVQASGTVVIQVLIDLDGTVFTAYPLSGHPLLRLSARNAACSSRFSPTLLNGDPIKVSGVISYNFVP